MLAPVGEIPRRSAEYQDLSAAVPWLCSIRLTLGIPPRTKEPPAIGLSVDPIETMKAGWAGLSTKPNAKNENLAKAVQQPQRFGPVPKNLFLTVESNGSHTAANGVPRIDLNK